MLSYQQLGNGTLLDMTVTLCIIDQSGDEPVWCEAAALGKRIFAWWTAKSCSGCSSAHST